MSGRVHGGSARAVADAQSAPNCVYVQETSFTRWVLSSAMPSRVNSPPACCGGDHRLGGGRTVTLRHRTGAGFRGAGACSLSPCAATGSGVQHAHRSFTKGVSVSPYVPVDTCSDPGLGRLAETAARPDAQGGRVAAGDPVQGPGHETATGGRAGCQLGGRGYRTPNVRTPGGRAVGPGRAGGRNKASQVLLSVGSGLADGHRERRPASSHPCTVRFVSCRGLIADPDGSPARRRALFVSGNVSRRSSGY